MIMGNPDLLQLAVFLAASIALLVIFRQDLRSARSHGFYRFWAFEAILLLAVRGADQWFPISCLPDR